MPDDAPAVKVAATRGYGGEVILYDRHTEDREALGRRLAEKRGLTLIPPYDHPHVMAGQGASAKELFEDAGPLDVLLVPLGGGGLLSGCAIAARAFNPACTIVGVARRAMTGSAAYVPPLLSTLIPQRRSPMAHRLSNWETTRFR
jgi:threo-3-hydroxy-L-aspartate ammonia-lyase